MSDQGQKLINLYAYTPFGIIANQIEAIVQPFKFVGRYGVMAESNGLYYMRARYYDPVLGRFISEDPIGFAGGSVNLYAYVSNNPVNLIDPYGLSTEDEPTPDPQPGPRRVPYVPAPAPVSTPEQGSRPRAQTYTGPTLQDIQALREGWRDPYNPPDPIPLDLEIELRPGGEELLEQELPESFTPPD